MWSVDPVWTAGIFMIGVVTGALGWATVGEWAIRALARHLSSH